MSWDVCVQLCLVAVDQLVICLQVEENTRKSLFKLRSTWDEVFPLKKLYALDVRVNSVDPAWPIKPLPPTVNASIHVNPKFLKQVCMCGVSLPKHWSVKLTGKSKNNT